MITNKWTALYILDNSTKEMKKIGNINISTDKMSLYPEGYYYLNSPHLYYVNDLGLYEKYYIKETKSHSAFLNGYSEEDEGLY